MVQRIAAIQWQSRANQGIEPFDILVLDPGGQAQCTQRTVGTGAAQSPDINDRFHHGTTDPFPEAEA